MSCPTCGHTLACLFVGSAYDPSPSLWHCERCGTAVVEHPHPPKDVYVPKLVDRCRAFQETLPKTIPTARPGRILGMDAVRATWDRLGLRESIHPPQETP